MEYSHEFVTHVWVRDMFKSCETLPCLPYPPPSVFVHTLAQMPVWCNIYMSPCHICESSWHTWVIWTLPWILSPPFSIFVHTLAQMPLWCDIYTSSCHIYLSSWHVWIVSDTALPHLSTLLGGLLFLCTHSSFCAHTCSNAFMMQYVYEFVPHTYEFVTCLSIWDSDLYNSYQSLPCLVSMSLNLNEARY